MHLSDAALLMVSIPMKVDTFEEIGSSSTKKFVLIILGNNTLYLDAIQKEIPKFNLTSTLTLSISYSTTQNRNQTPIILQDITQNSLARKRNILSLRIQNYHAINKTAAASVHTNPATEEAICRAPEIGSLLSNGVPPPPR